MKRSSSYIINIDTLRIAFFAHFQPLINYGTTVCRSLPTTHNVHYNKKNNENHVGTRSSSCRGGFKNLDLQTVPSLYIFTLKVFVIRNLDNFQTNSSIHSIDTRHMNQLHLTSVKFPSIQERVTYSSVKILNKLPLNISKLHTHIVNVIVH